MAERVHPVADLPDAAAEPEKPKPKPNPPAAAYVIQIPKDQIYRVPPPESAEKFEAYSRRAASPRLPCCCRFLACSLAAALLVLLLAAASAVVLYLVFQPRLPSYSLDRLSISGLNLSSAASDLTLSPEIVATVRAKNPNEKIAIEYGRGSAKVSYSGLELCGGAWPAFYQGARNETAFRILLKGSGLQLSRALHAALQAEQRRGEVPLEVLIDVPVRVKVGAAWSWTMDVKLGCDVKVDKLTAESRIVSKTCRVKVGV